jgi:hypothetical protein
METFAQILTPGHQSYILYMLRHARKQVYKHTAHTFSQVEVSEGDVILHNDGEVRNLDCWDMFLFCSALRVHAPACARIGQCVHCVND